MGVEGSAHRSPAQAEAHTQPLSSMGLGVSDPKLAVVLSSLPPHLWESCHYCAITSEQTDTQQRGLHTPLSGDLSTGEGAA